MGSLSTPSRPLLPSVFAPIPTFFDANEELDIPTFTSHVVYLAKCGMNPVISGSMGEAHHLTPSERTELIVSARKALDDAGLSSVPTIVGTGVGSTKGSIELCTQAAAAGADYAIVICSGYYAGALPKPAFRKFFVDVAKASPIPVMIYNYPGACGGLDLDSDDIVAIAQASDNICGVKLTCGNVGKLIRISAVTGLPSFAAKRANPAPFIVFGGFADFILQTVLSSKGATKGDGAIVGLGNLYPNSIVKVFKLAQYLKENPGAKDWESVFAEAQHLQDLVAQCDFVYAGLGVAGTKSTLQLRRGYGGNCRLPLLPFPHEKLLETEAKECVKALNKIEKELDST